MNSADAWFEPPMRLERIRVDNFKSLVDFELQLAPFTCLIGLNGAGKSTVLQAIDFAAQLFRGDIDGWLAHRGWQVADLGSKLTKRSNIAIELWLSAGPTRFHWSGAFNRARRRCTREQLSINGESRFTVGNQRYDFPLRACVLPLLPQKTRRGAALDRGTRIGFQYSGSLLSQLDPDLVPESVHRVLDFMCSIALPGAPSPRQPGRRADREGRLGFGGENPGAFLNASPFLGHPRLPGRIESLYRELEAAAARPGRPGKQGVTQEVPFDQALTAAARHGNDAMLRLLPVFAELLTDSGVLLFDEVENGINPQLVEPLLGALVTARQQVLVTTHSPVILNALDDDLARAGVQYLYRTPEGFTRSVPFFSIPSVSEKLDVMGPGEAFVDTDLTRLQDEIRSMAGYLIS